MLIEPEMVSMAQSGLVAPIYVITVTGPLLYSTNAWITWHIKHTWNNDSHYVWCSEYFDPSAYGRDHAASLIPVSSSPAAIYERLQEDVATRDNHSDLIERIRAAMLKAATDWRGSGSIDEKSYQEIVELLMRADIGAFRPVIYVIPRELIDSRVVEVDMKRRAGAGPEHLIEDLKGAEFDFIRIRHA